MKPKLRTKKRQHHDSLDIAELIDGIFSEPSQVKFDKSANMTCFGAITRQLWIQANSGSRKAARLLRRYLKFATAQAPADTGPEIRYGDDLLTTEEVYRKYGRSMP